jgi:hypothetical protein
MTRPPGTLHNEDNCFVDLNDGTWQRTLGRRVGVVGLHGHDKHARHLHKTTLRRAVPAKAMVFNGPACVRLLHCVAVLKLRYLNLQIVAETIDEMRDQTRKGPPPPRGFWSRHFDRLFAVVDTGDINEILKQARAETDRTVKQFFPLAKLDPLRGYAYLQSKRDEGHKYLELMSEIYSRASQINREVAEGDRNLQFAELVTLKLIKLQSDLLVKFLGMVIPSHAATAIEFVYECLTDGDMPERLSNMKKPDLAGIWSGTKKLWRETVVESAAKMTLPEYAKYMRELAEKEAEEEIEELFLKLGIKPGKNLEQSLELLEELAEGAEKQVFSHGHWATAPMSEWLHLRQQENALAGAMKKSARHRMWTRVSWVFFLVESGEKVHEFYEFVREGPERD